MTRRSLASLLLLAVTAYSGLLVHAQQETPSPHPGDRPIKVKMVSAPFANYRYRLGWGTQGKYFAGFSQMVFNLSVPNQPPRSPGTERLPSRIKYEAITLERGVTHDSSFAQWAGRAQGHQQSRDLVIDTFDEAGRKSTTQQLTGCLVADYQSLPDLDGGANRVTIEHIKLSCRGVK
jgi:phage tail-like protein